MSEEEFYGTLLKQKRQALGVSFEEMGERTRIRPAHLKALEEGRVEELPGGEAYRTGFLRLYAEALGLDAGDIIARYRREIEVPSPDGPVLTDRAVEFPAELSSPSRPLIWPLVLVAAVVLGLLLFFVLQGGFKPSVEEPASAPATDSAARGGQAPGREEPAATVLKGREGDAEAENPSGRPEKISPEDAETQTAVSDQAQPGPAAAPGDWTLPEGGADLRLEALSDCSIRVTVDNGEPRSYDLPEGAVLRWSVQQAFRLVAQDSGQVRLWLDGRALDLAGQTEVVLTPAAGRDQEEER